MDDAEPDQLVFEQMMAEPSARSEVARVWEVLEGSIRQSKFNRERAEQMFLFVVDNCAHRYFRKFPGGAAVLFPKAVRKPFAAELAKQFITAHGDITSQRPVRTGLLRPLLGK